MTLIVKLKPFGYAQGKVFSIPTHFSSVLIITTLMRSSLNLIRTWKTEKTTKLCENSISSHVAEYLIVEIDYLRSPRPAPIALIWKIWENMCPYPKCKMLQSKSWEGILIRLNFFYRFSKLGLHSHLWTNTAIMYQLSFYYFTAQL